MLSQQPTPIPPIGIFGGTFDPVHYGHLRLAEEAADALKLAQVRWIPAGQPGLRSPPKASAKQRLAMVQKAIADNPRFTLDAAEVLANEPSYTANSLQRLRQSTMGSQQPLVLIVGADSFAQMPNWHRFELLLELAHIAVAQRPGFSIQAEKLNPVLAELLSACSCTHVDELAEAPAGRIFPFSTTPLDISATQIRARLSKGQSARYLMPDPLISYVQTHFFYTEKPTNS